MDIDKILKLAEIGFTKDEILKLATSTPDGNATADKQQANENAGQFDPQTEGKKNESISTSTSTKNENINTKNENTKSDDMSAKLLASMEALTKTIQASNLKNDTVTTVEETTADIISSMFGKKEK